MTKEEFKKMLKESLEEMLQDGTITIDVDTSTNRWDDGKSVDINFTIGEVTINRSAYL